MACTENEKILTQFGAYGVKGVSFAGAIIVGGMSVGAFSPGSAAILAGGNIAAEGIRTICSENPEGKIGIEIAREAGHIGVRAAAIGINPLGGVLGDIAVEGATALYDVASGNFQIVPQTMAAESGIALQPVGEPGLPLQVGAPRKLFPDSVLAQADAAVPKNHQVHHSEGTGHGLAGKDKPKANGVTVDGIY